MISSYPLIAPVVKYIYIIRLFVGCLTSNDTYVMNIHDDEQYYELCKNEGEMTATENIWIVAQG